MILDNISVITVAKVGSSNFLHSLKHKYKKKLTHTHSLKYLKDILCKENQFIIVGIRNPIDRNLSYLFQGYNNKIENSLKIKSNNYKGEYTFIKEMSLDTKPSKVIDLYFQQNYHYTFNDWFHEFFEITKINKETFHKEKGLHFYSLPRNNKIMIYTLEKLNDNIKELCSLFDIPTIIHSNNSQERPYKELYNNVKKEIKYTKEHLDKLFNTDIMKFFYSEDDIKNMYNKYK